MKKYIFLYSVLLILFCSCYKANNAPQSNNAPLFDIFIQGTNSSANIKDSVVTISTNDSTSFGIELSFSLLSGNPQNYPVSCFINGLPTGITMTSPDTVTFKLSSETTFNFSVYTDTGVYSLSVNVITPDGLNAYPLTLHVLPKPPNSGFDTTYYGDDLCTSLSGDFERIYMAQISADNSNPYRIWIYNFFGAYYIYADLTGTYPSETIKIPLQNANGNGSASVNPAIIYGTGFSAPDTSPYANNKPMIYINDTIVSGGDTQFCTTRLKTHQ